MYGIVLMTFESNQKNNSVKSVKEELVGVFKTEKETNFILDKLNELMKSEQKSIHGIAHRYHVFNFEPQDEYEDTDVLEKLGNEFLKQMNLKRVL